MVRGQALCLLACQVDAVIVCCSTVAPTPSLAAALVHRFGMRPDVITYNLAGMGCAASTVAVGLARELMQVKILVKEYITIFFINTILIAITRFPVLKD